MDHVDKKLLELSRVIGSKKELAVAFSGGIDSTLIGAVAFRELGEKSIAITIDSDTFSRGELEYSKTIAKEIGIKQYILKTSEMDNPDFVENSSLRCYYCKKEEIDIVLDGALELGFKTIAFGVNTSDFGEHRPGIKALQEASVFMPLLEAEIGKPEIPELAERLGLSNHNMPSTTCLASRIPYGDPITKEKLLKIEDAENLLLNMGISMCRVRLHGTIARIEVSEPDLYRVVDNRKDLHIKFRELGFTYVSLDLKGYVSGSMNAVLKNGDQKN